MAAELEDLDQEVDVQTVLCALSEHTEEGEDARRERCGKSGRLNITISSQCLVHSLRLIVHTLILLQCKPPRIKSRLAKLLNRMVKRTNNEDRISHRAVIRKRDLVLVLLVKTLGILLRSDARLARSARLTRGRSLFTSLLRGSRGSISTCTLTTLRLLLGLKMGSVVALAITEVVGNDAELPQVEGMGG